MTTTIALKYIGIMYSDKEIFSSWLKKVVKGEDVIKGKILAKRVGIAPSTISGWFHGKSKGPEKPIAVEICKILKADYDEIIKTGRRELQPQPDTGILKRIEALEQKQSAPVPPEPINFLEAKNKEHHETINKFQDQETALRINQKLVLAESIDPKLLKKIEKIIDIELESAPRQEPKQAQASNDVPGE